jgi:mono/diheme cytochrome c family protein
VVSENAGNNPPAPVATASGSPNATPAPVASAIANASPTVAAPSPAAPVPSATTTMTTANATLLANNPNAQKAQGGPSTGGTMRRIGDFPVEVGPAKLATPVPEPFKPRPTPTIVVENGKIKQQWAAPADVASQTNPLKNKADAVKLGRELYLQRCADCHGREGKGNGYLSAQLKRDGQSIAPTNLTSQMVQANTDGELFWKITKGRSPMPASGVRFSDEERWAIVSFLRTLK